MDDLTVNNQIKKLQNTRKIGQELADELAELAGCLHFFDLEPDIADLHKIIEIFRKRTFKVPVIGDLAMGKSTLLNVLMGEKILATGVSPLTAFVQRIRYGLKKRVTIHFNNKKPPQTINFDVFKEFFTVDDDECRKLECERKEAFPDVDYVVVEHPLPLLATGLEFLDTPGLLSYDTETPKYIEDADAIIFVFLATKPCTKFERNYLECYIKDKGITVFFLVNKWDQIASQLDDEDEREVAERKLRNIFRTNLEPYCIVNGQNLYEQRVFETDALMAFRARKKGESLEGTGINKFLFSLLNFQLQQEKLMIFNVKSVVRNIHQKVHHIIAEKLNNEQEMIHQLEKKYLNTIVNQIKQDIKVDHHFEGMIGEQKEKLNRLKDRLSFLDNEILKIRNDIDQTFERYMSQFLE